MSRTRFWAAGWLALLIALGAPAIGLAEKPDFTGRTVTAVSLEGPSGFPTAELKRFLEIRPGDRFSLRQTGRTIEVLSKLGEFEDVQVLAIPDGAGVRVMIRVFPRPRVRKISVLGANSGNSRAVAALGLSVGDAYPGDGDLPRMAEDVRRAYHAAGWPQAVVEVRHVSTGDRDVQLEVEVEEGVRQRIGEIAITGDYHGAFEPRELVKESRLSPGDPLTEGRLEAARRRVLSLHRKLGYLESFVQVVMEAKDDGNAKVTLFVRSGERVRAVFEKKKVHSADRRKDLFWFWEFRDAKLESVLELGGESNISDGFATEAAERIAHYYRGRGYLEVSVDSTLVVRPAKRTKTLRFEIDPGRRYRLLGVEFNGNDESRKETRSAALRSAFLGHTPVLSRRFYREEEAELATAHLIDYYRSEGFAAAEVHREEPVVDHSSRTVNLRFEVDEGPRSVVGTLSFDGNDQVTSETLHDLIDEPSVGIREGKPLNLIFLERADLAIEDYYASVGFPYASATHRAVAGTDGRLNIGFGIDESIQAYFGRVVIRGNEFTRRKVIDRAVPIAAGDVFTPAALQETEAALMKLGTFNRVVAKPLGDDQPERVRDVVIGVSEANRYVLEPSLGASTDDGPRIGVRALHRNLFGSAKSISLRAQANWRWDGFLGETRGVNEVGPAVDYGKIEERVILTYSQPTTFGEPIRSAASASLFERERKRTFRYSGNRLIAASTRDLQVGWGPLRKADIALVGRYQMFLRDIQYDGSTSKERRDNAAQAALEPADFPLEPARSMFYYPFKWKIASASLGALVDRRNDRFNPTGGFIASVNTELASKLLGSDFDFAKVTGSLTTFRRLPGSFVLAAALRGGYAAPFHGTTGLPIDQRFHLGGTGSVRGFKDGSIGPHFEQVQNKSTGGDLFGLYNLELRRPLVGGLEWVFFHDAGWSRIADPESKRTVSGPSPGRNALVNPSGPSTAVGLGLRARTPVGPVKFDVGIDTARISKTHGLGDANNFEIHFTIGDL